MKQPLRILSTPFRLANMLTFGLFGWLVFYAKFLASIVLAIWIIQNGALIQKYLGFDPSFWLGKLADWLEWLIYYVLNWLKWIPTTSNELRALKTAISGILLYASALFPAQLIIYTVIWLFWRVVSLIKWQLISRVWFLRQMALWSRTLTVAVARDELLELCPPETEPDAFVNENLERFAKG